MEPNETPTSHGGSFPAPYRKGKMLECDCGLRFPIVRRQDGNEVWYDSPQWEAHVKSTRV